jgi:aminodeoxyfutalosine deaminase
MNQVALDISQYIQEMPKAEIHIHLEGAIQPETVIKLAERHNCEDILPGTSAETLQNWFTFTDFPHFIEVFLTILKLLRTAEDFALITYENGADMAAQNIRYRELTITPNMHTNQHGKSLSIEEVLEGLEEGRRRAFQEFGVEMRWVFDCSRTLSFPDRKRGTYDPRPAQRTLEYAMIGMDRGVIGLGLGGYEVGAPPEPFAEVFAAAKKSGLLSLPHAGETVGPKSVWGAMNALQADRIGHGVRAIEDPKLLLAIKERKIPLEISPTSNKCLHIFEDMSDHPLPRFDEMGILITVNSDDPPLFNTTLCKEYEILARVFGYDKANISRIARNAFNVSGAEPELKARLLAEFDEWVISQNSAG